MLMCPDCRRPRCKLAHPTTLHCTPTCLCTVLHLDLPLLIITLRILSGCEASAVLGMTHHSCMQLRKPVGFPLGQGWILFAGAVVIPSDKGFPGTATEVQSQAPGKRPVFFATAGESGRVKIWSSATAQCVYEHQGLGTTAGGNYTAVAMLPGRAGLMAATADCNLLFLQPKVSTVLPSVACSFCYSVLVHL